MSSRRYITSTYQIPDEPKHTCPMIDDVISILEEQFGAGDGSIDLMEKIRTNCSDIRDWGESWKKYSEYIEEEKDDFEKKVDELSEQLSEKETEISDLQKKIEELESKVFDLEHDLTFNYEKIEE